MRVFRGQPAQVARRVALVLRAQRDHRAASEPRGRREMLGLPGLRALILRFPARQGRRGQRVAQEPQGPRGLRVLLVLLELRVLPGRLVVRVLSERQGPPGQRAASGRRGQLEVPGRQVRVH